MLSRFGGLPSGNDVKTLPSSQTPIESDLPKGRPDGIGEPIDEDPTPQIYDPRPQIEEDTLFKYSRRSLKLLDGHHPKHGFIAPIYPPLADVTRLAINYSVVDITVLSTTLRLLSEQKSFYEAGTSKTMNSLHLEQDDGFGHAVDLGALERGSVSWRPEVYFDLADAMQRAARELDVPVIWGGCWAPLNGVKDIDELHAEYIARKRAQGKRPFFDGPHFEVR